VHDFVSEICISDEKVKFRGKVYVSAEVTQREREMHKGHWLTKELSLCIPLDVLPFDILDQSVLHLEDGRGVDGVEALKRRGGKEEQRSVWCKYNIHTRGRGSGVARCGGSRDTQLHPCARSVRHAQRRAGSHNSLRRQDIVHDLQAKHASLWSVGVPPPALPLPLLWCAREEDL